jgi:hypothetical protein
MEHILMDTTRRRFLKQAAAIAATTTLSSPSEVGADIAPEQIDGVQQLPNLSEEIKRTKFDFVVYAPKSPASHVCRTIDCFARCAH